MSYTDKAKKRFKMRVRNTTCFGKSASTFWQKFT